MPSDHKTFMHEPDWRAEASHTEWAFARTLASLGLPVLFGFGRKQYHSWRKRKQQQEAMLDSWSKLKESITPEADDQPDLRVIAEEARSEARTARVKLGQQNQRLEAIEGRMDSLESTLVDNRVIADRRHTELIAAITKLHT